MNALSVNKEELVALGVPTGVGLLDASLVEVTLSVCLDGLTDRNVHRNKAFSSLQ